MKLFNFQKNKYSVELLMDVGKYTDIPNYFFESDLHSTDFYEIIYFNKGLGYLELDQQKVPIKMNTIVFISPFQKRKWHVDKSKIDCYILIFKDGFLSSFFSDKLFIYRLQYFYRQERPVYLFVDIDFSIKLKSVLQDLIEEVKRFKADSEHIIRALLYFLLLKLNRLYADYYNVSPETQNSNIPFRFKQLLIENGHKQRAINYYAVELGISRITLNKYIKLQFGITASQMIMEHVVLEIKNLLMYTNFSVKEIADKLHFSEPNHLSRLFKAVTGMRPGVYRKTFKVM